MVSAGSAVAWSSPESSRRSCSASRRPGRSGLSRRLGVLTAGATAICGASAAIAIASVLPHDEKSERELVFTIAGVTALSTVAMVIYPVIVKVIGLDPHQTGLFLGGTIHDVAQVVGAGYSISAEVGDVAVVTKLLRVSLLLPVVMVISLSFRHRVVRADTGKGNPLFPAFLLAFAGFVAAGSLGLIPKVVGPVLNDVARACLVLAKVAGIHRHAEMQDLAAGPHDPRGSHVAPVHHGRGTDHQQQIGALGNQ